MAYLVEPINYNDYIDLMNLFRVSCEESRYKNHVANKDKFLDRLEMSIDNTDINMAIKCIQDGEIVGMFILELSNLDPFELPVGIEWGFYVYPEHRGTLAAKNLFDYAFKWTKEHGGDRIISIIHFGEDNTKTYNFCESMQMREVGRMFERVL